MPTSQSQLPLAKALVIWLVLLCVEFTHGTLRVLFLAPRLGDFLSRQIGVFTGSLLILLVVYFFAPWLGRPTTRSLLTIGAIWFVLTIGFELAMGAFLFPVSRMLEDYDLLHGGLLPLGLVFLLFSPLLAFRLRRRTTS